MRRPATARRGTSGRWRALAALSAALVLVLPGLRPGFAGAEGTVPGEQTSPKAWEARFGGKVELGDDPSLEDYLAAAASSDPGLVAAFMEWKAALAGVPGASSLPDPVFTWGYYIENVETRVGPQRQRFALRQSFPWFGTLSAREGIAAAEARAAFERFEQRRLSLFYGVTKAYGEYYLLGRRIEIAKSTLDLVEQWEEVARMRYAAGSQDFEALTRIEIERLRLEDRVRALEDSRRPAVEELRGLVGFSADHVPPFPPTLPVLETAAEDSLMRSVEEENPGVRALGHIVMRNEEAARLAGKLSWPDFTIGLDWIDTGDALNPSAPESGKDPWMVSLSVKLPIWFGSNSAAREAAAARLEMSRYRLRDERQALRARAERALFEYRDALSRKELYDDALIPRAEEAQEVSLRAYESGKVGFLRVLEAQRLLLDLRLEREEASVAATVGAAELMMLSGGGGEDRSSGR